MYYHSTPSCGTTNGDSMNHRDAYYYALGYYQGRRFGQFEIDEFENMTPEHQDYYRTGYDDGVLDYCEIDC